MSQHPAGRYNTVAPFRRGPPAPLYFSELTTPRQAIVFMAEFDVDAISTATKKRLAAQIGVFQGLYRQSRQITVLDRDQRRYATRPLLTSPDDNPAMTEIYGQLAPVRLDRNLDTSNGGRFGPVANSAVGVLTLNNNDGSLDDLDTSVAIVGRDVRISAGALSRSPAGVETVGGGAATFDVLGTEDGDDLVTELSEQIAIETTGSSVLHGFGPIFTGVVESTAWSRSELQIKVRDARLRLERPVQRHTYSGAFGFDGTPEMEGMTRPLAFGRCTGIEPVLVDPILLIYQYHDGETLEIQAVYDGGLKLERAATARSYAEMAAFVAPSGDDPDGDFPLGSYVGCPIVGCFRLAGPAERQVTADVRGSGGASSLVEPFSDGTFFTDGTGWEAAGRKLHANNVAGILLRILIDHGDLSEKSVAVEQLRQIAVELPYDGGLFFAAGESSSVLDAASQLTLSLGCVLIRAKDGRYQLRRLAPPTDVPVLIIRDDMIVPDSLERQALAYRIPWTDWEVSFARNWTPLSETEIFSAVERERRIGLTRTSQITRITNDIVAAIYPERATARIDTVLTKHGDAREVGNRHVALHAHGRVSFALRAMGIAYRLELLDTVRVVSPRFGLDQGRNMLVIEVGEDGDAIETRLRLFG